MRTACACMTSACLNPKLKPDMQALGPIEAEAAAEWGATLDAYCLRLQD